MTDKERTATCACKQLSLSVTGDPIYVIGCSCFKCQRRTGSVFGVTSYFPNAQVLNVSGDSNSYVIESDSGAKTERRFCPACGGTVFWEAGFLPDHTGIPVGAFGDPDFPEPTISAWNQSKHHWVTFPEHIPSSLTQKFDD